MTKNLKRLLIIIGTRPEAIKLAPVVLEAIRTGVFSVQVVTTGQHREMLDQMIRQFDIKVDCDLDIMQPNQSLCDVTTSALDGLYGIMDQLKPDCVVVQGDTTTTFCGALAAFYRNIPVAHVEAGLRTFNKQQPYPEEVNRCLTTQVADFHFAPTPRARENLLREAVSPENIWVTGNTAIDALHATLNKYSDKRVASKNTRTLLLTTHRRENQGAPMTQICNAIVRLVERYSDLEVVIPVHLSPAVKQVINPILGGNKRIKLLKPLDYSEFVLLMDKSFLILTDSGGIQEEAPSLAKPVLVLREVTERPEANEAGTSILVGTDEQRIFEEASRLLDDKTYYNSMTGTQNPYGDGFAAKHIIQILRDNL